MKHGSLFPTFLFFLLNIINLAEPQNSSCYYTSTIFYGGSAFSQLYAENATVSASTGTIMSTSSITSGNPTLSDAPGFGSLSTDLNSGAEQSIASEHSSLFSNLLSSYAPSLTATTKSSISSAATTIPTVSTLPSPLYIQVNTGHASKLRKRDINYIGFSGDDGILVATINEAAIFELLNGYLSSEGEFIGQETRNNIGLFEKFSSPSAASQDWFSSGSSLNFGSATFCYTSNNSFYIVSTSIPTSECYQATLKIVSASALNTTSIMTSPSQNITGSGSDTGGTSLPLSNPIVSSATALSATASSDSTSAHNPSSSMPSQTGLGSVMPSTSLIQKNSTNASVPSLFSTPSNVISSMGSFSTSVSSSSTMTSGFLATIPSNTAPASTATSFSGSSASTRTSNSIVSSSLASSTNLMVPNSSSTFPPATSSTIRSTSSNSLQTITTTTVASSLKSTTSSFISPIVTVTTSTTRSITTSTQLSSSPTPVTNTGKRGLVYTNINNTQFFSLSGQNSLVSWCYDYYSLPNASNNVGPTNAALTFIPLLYNDAPSLTSVWSANVNASITSYKTDSILAFNEPDACNDGQSACMSVSASVSAYQSFMQPFAGTVQLGAPAVTNGGPPASLTYLSYFLGNCTGCTIDFVPLHWYASPYSFDYLTQYVTQAYQVAGGRPIWVTEFGMDSLNYNDADVQAFLKNATTWFDSQPFVHRYAWFGDFSGYLLNANGSGLSADGVIWNNYTGGYVYS